MIDHLFGRPNPSWKRAQVFLVIIFWLWRILSGNQNGPKLLWIRRLNRSLRHFTPWQLIVSTLCGVYATRNLDKILGLGSPEPLARLYSPSYYRATWISTGLDAGFATAMSIRPKWLRDICSAIFSIYYVIYATEADEKLRRFRAVPTVEMLRTTWEKTTNPYIRLFTNVQLPRITIRRKIFLPRPKSSSYQRPIAAYLYYAPPEHHLCKATDLVIDYPGGGFVAMSPEHHEERLTMWAWRTGKPILAIDYGKAPEYPYPFAINEAFDTYRILVETKGALIGMSGKKLNIIMSGDSAGATLAVNVVIKIIEHNTSLQGSPYSTMLPQPVSLILSYAALDFNFTSWMSPNNLRVLQSEQSTGNLPGLAELAKQKDHFGHVSPLSMVGEKIPVRSKTHLRRRKSWKDAIKSFAGAESRKEPEGKPALRLRHFSTSAIKSTQDIMGASFGRRERARTDSAREDVAGYADAESDEDDESADSQTLREEDRPIQDRVRYVCTHSPTAVPVVPSGSTTEKQQEKMLEAVVEADSQVTLGKTLANGKKAEPIGTRLTMTSRTGYFQDRIISPSMMRAMAIMYIGPHRNPDFATDYYISPILAPDHILAQFPPLLMQCGEKDPFVDDTVIFAGRVRNAKRARKAELDLAIAGKSARFGESLRMSEANGESLGSHEAAQRARLRQERDKLSNESEEDWVQVVIFSEWSHGYLQMPGLMKEAKALIEELGAWIDEAFDKYRWKYGNAEMSEGPLADDVKKGTMKEREVVLLQVPSRGNGDSNTISASSMGSETETDDSAITFVPRKHRARPESFRLEGADVKYGSGRTDSSGSDKTIREDDQDRDGGSKEDGVGNGDHSNSETTSDVHGSGPTQGETNDGKSHRTIPGKVNTPSRTGQTITETELMRRRRLLDAHIFD